MNNLRDMNTRGWRPFLYLNLSLFCQIISVGLGKQASLSMPQFTLQAILGNPWYFLAMLCLAFQSFFWPMALRHYPLTFAYFYMSLSYVAILIISWLLFHESVSVLNFMGAVLIVCGVNLMASEEGSQQHG